MAQGDPPSVSMAYSVSVDAKKVVGGVGICARYNEIVGCVFLQHYISLDSKIYADIKKIIHELNKDEFEKLYEMKI